MSNKDVLLKEIEGISDEQLREVIDLVLFLKSRQREEEIDVTLMGEPSLAKGWMKPEGDAVWSVL